MAPLLESRVGTLFTRFRFYSPPLEQSMQVACTPLSSLLGDTDRTPSCHQVSE